MAIARRRFPFLPPVDNLQFKIFVNLTLKTICIMETINLSPSLFLIIRLATNLIVASILILWIFNGFRDRKPFVFSLYLFNLVIFIIGSLLFNIQLSMGSGLGLFAIFAMLRYRSETLSLKEMTYLFILIAVGLINSISKGFEYTEILVFNLSIIGLTFILERIIENQRLIVKKIKYNNLELIKPEFKNLLMHDVYRKTGIRAKKIDYNSLNIIDKSVCLIVYYEENKQIECMDIEHMPNRNINIPVSKNGIDPKIKKIHQNF